MATINAAQLNLIRQYFLSFTGAQNPDSSGTEDNQLPEGSMKELVEIFTGNDYRKENLVSYLREKQAEELADHLDEIQQEFMFNLAELFIAGGKNEVTGELLKRKNKFFLEEVAFQQAMKENIKLIELEDRNKAFLAIHRQRLKEKKPVLSNINPAKEPPADPAKQELSVGKVIAAGIPVSASAAAAAFRVPVKKASQKGK